MTAFSLAQLFPHLRAFRCEQIVIDTQQVTLTLAARCKSAACPLCGYRAHQPLSRYTRTVQDVPCGNVPVILHLHVRRFRCGRSGCPRRIFAGQFPDLTPPRVRSTTLKQQATTHIDLALGDARGWRD